VPTTSNELIVPQYGPGATTAASSDDALRAKLPPAGPGRELFLREMLHVMPRSNDVYIGSNKQQLSAIEFYRMVGRPDLVPAVHAQQSKRGWLYLTSVLFLGAGIASGIVVMNNAQDLNDPSCFAQGTASYNKCVDSNSKTTLLGAGLIAGGAIMGGLFFTLAANTSDMVTSPDETAVMAARYNQGLSRKLTSEAPPRVEVTPVIGKGGGGLAAVMRF
jgi:hypothetical protein